MDRVAIRRGVVHRDGYAIHLEDAADAVESIEEKRRAAAPSYSTGTTTTRENQRRDARHTMSFHPSRDRQGAILRQPSSTSAS
jgi:hypothetical protein